MLLCLTLLFSASAVLAMPTPEGSPHHEIYKVCVPEGALESCHRMSQESDLHMTCVAARDRIECLDKIKHREADFAPVDPEDMYVAAKIPQQDFIIFKEIRTKEEPDEEFRYEAVCVIHKDLDITSIHGLQGLKSCHTGVGRNVGYKIPITKLRHMGVLGPLNNSDLTPRENELHALSHLFSEACLVGKWAPDPAQNQALKAKYPNLCALCEHPEICDYPDKYSGYDGALRCLAEHGGQVAWTKVYYVKKHFGMAIGAGEAVPTGQNPDDYAYLCPDATKKPITGKPCIWAARPWQGYMANHDLDNDIADLRAKISLADTIGETENADWLSKVLDLNNKTIPIDNQGPYSPENYLNKANYTDVIERDTGAPHRPVRFCVTSDAELEKCRVLKRAAYSRDIRPAFDCVREAGLHECLRTVRDDGADVITLDGGEVFVAQRQYNLKPIVAEQYGEHGSLYYAVAVVRKDSTYQSIEDLRGAKSCHTGYGRNAGWNVPLYTLLSKELISKNSCPYSSALSSYFSGGSCVPGAQLPENNPANQNPDSLCSICAGNLDAPNNDPAWKCSASNDESFFGYSGAFRCLASGEGQVAFVKHTTVPENTDGHNQAAWTAGLRSEDFELLCADGGRASINEYSRCHLAEVPPHMVVTSNDKTDIQLNEIRHAILAAGDLYSRRPDLFKLFGDFGGTKDLLFKNSATGLLSVENGSPLMQRYSEILEVIRACENQPTP
uniref:Transferrin n=1 Tax=Blaberus discoidalis TaxID=6981 RepID=TRF_BLADI|nr:RecName: Full=Transferrin; Flags: Precursor [Blaberus discoidalis]AAA27820.1 transferrin [Blaberus discoidalis]